MKTNVMIRIDEGLAQTAKELDLNFSKIAEDALKQAIEEETKPFGIVETSQILLGAELFYNVRDKMLTLVFVVDNVSDENVVSDRINYTLGITDRETFTNIPDRQCIQTFKGTILERETIPKGGHGSFGERLVPSADLAAKLSEVTCEDSKNLRWIVYPRLIANTRKTILGANYKQKIDEKGHFPVPRPLRTT